MTDRVFADLLRRKVIAVLFASSILLGIGSLSFSGVSATLATTDSVPSSSDESIVTETASTGLISSLYDRVEQSVVQISPQFSEFDIFRTPLPTENTAQGYGSGFVFDEQGHIVTNSHVVGTVNSTASGNSLGWKLICR